MGCSRCFKSLTSIVSVVLYFFDLITDILLARQFFIDGHTTWGILTVVFIGFPVPVYLCLTIYMACVEKEAKKRCLVFPALFCLPFLVVNNSCGIILHMCFVITDENDDDLYRMSTMSQVLEALLESVPQCVLQIYIILVDESITSFEDIGVTSLLSIASSIAMFTWSFSCYSRMTYKTNHLGYSMSFCAKVLDFCVKFCESVQRVFVVALFLSLPYQHLRFIFIGALVIHIAVLAIADLCTLDNSNSKLKKACYCIHASLLRTICYTNVNQIKKTKCRVIFHVVSVIIENFILCLVWFELKPSRLDWIAMFVWIALLALLVLQIILQLIYYSVIDKPDGTVQDSTMHKKFVKYIACPCCVYCDGSPQSDDMELKHV